MLSFLGSRRRPKLPREGQHFSERAANMIGAFDEGSDDLRRRLTTVLAQAAETAVTHAGGRGSLDRFLQEAEDRDVALVEQFSAQASDLAATKPDDTMAMLSDSYAAVALLCRHRLRALGESDRDLITMLAALYAAAYAASV